MPRNTVKIIIQMQRLEKVYSKSFFFFIRDIFPEIASLHSTLLRYFHYIFITFGMVVTYRINIDIMPGVYYIEFLY